jgi:hypothetical protein
MKIADVTASHAPASQEHGGQVRFALIASGCHSGSTMLDMLLGSHSGVSGSGEMNRLSLYSEDRRCTCAISVATCPYWSRVLEQIARATDRQKLHWSDCHTDVPPLDPVVNMADSPDLGLEEGGALPTRLVAALAERGIATSPEARLTYGGVRDPKWRLLHGKDRQGLVVRRENGRVMVYPPLLQWKNTLRKLPSLLELTLALGAERGLGWLAQVSQEAENHLRAARNSWRVAEAMSAIDGSRVVVDSSKSAVRLKLIYATRPDAVRVIHLVRDGRAVAASAIRRRGQEPQIAARIWKRENQHLRLVLRSMPAGQIHRLRYEDLCEAPERELRGVCDFLGLDFEPAMVQLWYRPVHNIPGNPLLFKDRQRSIAKDERWRRDLSPDQLAEVERVTGPLNRAFGYS